MTPWPVTRDGLTFRLAREDDLPVIASFRNDPQVNRWMIRTHVEPEQLRSDWLDPVEGDHSCIVERDGELVGLGLLEAQDATGQPGKRQGTDAMIGYIVRPGHEGQGIATATARELVRAAFEDLGLRRVIAYAHADNPASLRVLEKAGTRRELYAKQSIWNVIEGWVDEVGYGLLADEWRAEQRVLRTERLVLRPWREHDIDFLLDLYGREDVVRYLSGRTISSPEEARASICRRREWFETPPHGIWLVETHAGERVGNLLLKPIPPSAGSTTDDIEIGWHLHPDAQGSGYATEAARAVLAHAGEQGLTHIVAVTHPDNAASQRVCNRLGMTAQGRTKRYYDAEVELFTLDLSGS